MSSADTHRPGGLVVCLVAGLLAVPAAVADYAWTLHGIHRSSEELQAGQGYELRAWIYLAVLTAGLIASVPLLTVTADRAGRKGRLREWFGMTTGVAALFAVSLSYENYVIHHRGYRPFPALQIWMAVAVLLAITVYLTRKYAEPDTAPMPAAGHDELPSPTSPSLPTMRVDQDPPSAPPALDLTDRQALITSTALCAATLVLAVVAMPTGCGSATPAIGALFFAGIVLALFGLWCLCTRHWAAGLLPITLALPAMYLSALGSICDTLPAVSP